MSENIRKLAVLGSPIAHSKSPALHAAAYRVLGLPWEYGLEEVRSDELAAFVLSRGTEWRGLSLTMPLKREVLPLLDEIDPVAELTGAANTVLFDGAARRGFNTDVFGIQQVFERAGLSAVTIGHILGGGATATSTLVALQGLGITKVVVSVRDITRTDGLAELAERIGVGLRIGLLSDAAAVDADVIVSTLPGHAEHGVTFPEAVRRRSILLDVAYDPWPSRLSTAWSAGNGRVFSGLEMLLYQALAQVRIFVGGSPDIVLADEDRVLAAMRESVGLLP